MRHWNNAIAIALVAGATLAVPAQPAPSPTAPAQAPSLTVDSDPVPAPPTATAVPPPSLQKRGKSYLLKKNVDEVVLNCTVLKGSQLVQGLKESDFEVYEDGVRQKLISFQHTDLPVSLGLVIDNSGSMYDKRPAVNRAALDMIRASNPDDQSFVVNFSDEAFLDQDFTSSISKLRDALSHIDSRGGTALYDAVVASADHLVEQGTRPKQVLVLITDGDDDASTLNLVQTIRRVQDLSGPVIYSIGLLFGNDLSREEARHARRALQLLSQETGGIAFFPKSLSQVDGIAAEVARDIRSQYTLGYRSTKPMSIPGFRRVEVTAKAKGMGKLTVLTRTGYFPNVALGGANQVAAVH
jgi:VWFA-related protein